MDRDLYSRTLSLSIQWSLISAALLSVGYFLLRNAILPLFTPLESVLEAAKTYDVWIALFLWPQVSDSFLWDFTGATEIGPVRNSMFWLFSSSWPPFYRCPRFRKPWAVARFLYSALGVPYSYAWLFPG
ncbi:hypothetical protein PO124_29405 [Bacillus licheniformis]|nr:hypothetical protein [Bacillus licheniformis]